MMVLNEGTYEEPSKFHLLQCILHSSEPNFRFTYIYELSAAYLLPVAAQPCPVSPHPLHQTLLLYQLGRSFEHWPEAFFMCQPGSSFIEGTLRRAVGSQGSQKGKDGGEIGGWGNSSPLPYTYHIFQSISHTGV